MEFNYKKFKSNFPSVFGGSGNSYFSKEREKFRSNFPQIFGNKSQSINSSQEKEKEISNTNPESFIIDKDSKKMNCDNLNPQIGNNNVNNNANTQSLDDLKKYYEEMLRKQKEEIDKELNDLDNATKNKTFLEYIFYWYYSKDLHAKKSDNKGIRLIKKYVFKLYKLMKETLKETSSKDEKDT